MHELRGINLTVDGLEAMRLSDVLGFAHEDAAQKMGISRPTFSRILSEARRTVATALTRGWAINIEGGNFKFKGGKCEIGPDPPSDQKAKIDNKPYDFKKEKNKEASMNKIAISSEGPTLDDLLDPRFGRAAGFIVVDPQSLEFEYIDNGVSQSMSQGAGIQAAENVARAGVKAVLTGNMGPKAFMALDRAGIQVAQNLENITVREAIERFKQGDVSWASSPNRKGHGR